MFNDKLNRFLAEVEFDLLAEHLRHLYYETGRPPSIPPGVYFRMVTIGYLEGIGSHRGIGWRCDDSRALGRFYEISRTEETLDCSSLTRR